MQDAADMRNGFLTPEAAALEGWPASASVRVLSVEVRGDQAQVELAVESSYPYWVDCERVDGRWYEGNSGNGRNTVFFDDEADSVE